MSKTIPSQPSRLAVAVGAALSMTGVPAAAAPDQVGRVLSAQGVVVATLDDGGTRSLGRGASVYEGETIKTPRGRVQIRFQDGGMVSLKRGSRFEVARYDTAGDAGVDSAGGDDGDGDGGGGNVVMRLFEGAMRTITGAVGDDNGERYRMETPVATVGIRGTQYALQYCGDGGCGGNAQGLYGQVIDSAVTVDNDAGSAQFGSGRYFQVASETASPQAIVKPPEAVLSGADLPEGASDDAADEGGTADGDDSDSDSDSDGEDTLTSDTAPSRGDDEDTTELDGTEFSETDETVDETTEEVGELSELSVLTDTGVAVGLVGEHTETGRQFSNGGVCLSARFCTPKVDGDDDLRALQFGSSEQDAAFELAAIDDDSLAESGTVSSLDAVWGRWRGDIRLSSTDNEDVTIDGSVPWAYSTNPATTSELESAFEASGTLSTDSVTGPSPVGTVNADTWSVDTLEIDVDVTGKGTAKADYVSLALSGPESISVNNTNTAVIDPSDGDRGFVVALESSDGEDSGGLSALFAGDGADGLLVGFDVKNFDGEALQEVISGVKVLKLKLEPQSFD